MGNITWNNTRLHQEAFSVNTPAGHQLELQRLNRRDDGIPVFLLPGFGHDSSLYFPSSESAGLAPTLASAGYDVFIADLSGKGKSWPVARRAATWGLHQSIMEDIPAHLSKLAQIRPGVPQIWGGQGLGSVLLSCVFARLDLCPAPVRAMVHFAPGRLCQLNQLPKALGYMAWQSWAQLSSLCRGYVSFPLGSKAPESRQMLADWQHWHESPDWLDPVDGFDYRHALQGKSIPRSLYLANRHNSVWGGLEDCRAWIKELGQHDARVLALGKSEGNRRNYSAGSMLSHPEAPDDHFQSVRTWLDEVCEGVTEGHADRIAV